MRLDINYVKKETFYCTEKIIATVSQFFGRNYEMIFVNAIKSYNVANLEETISVLTEVENFNMKELISDLEKYHGIKFYDYECATSTEALDFIKYELSKNRPVVVEVDIFSLPWLSEKDYKYFKSNNIKESSVLLIIGIEEDNIKCFDLHYANCEKNISVKCLEKGIFLYSLTGFEVKDELVDYEKKKYILQEKIKSLFVKNDFGLNVFEQTMLFAQEIFSFEVFKGEAKLYGFKQLCYLKGCINKLYRAKNLFSLTLDYMTNILADENLKKLTIYYKEVVSIWYSTFLIALKAHMKKDYTIENIELISKNINDACVKEKKIFKEIIELDIANVTHKKRIEDKVEEKQIMYDSLYVSIDRYLNDNSFLCAYNIEDSKIISGKFLLKDDYSFKISKNIYNIDSDNISCNGQIIDIPIINGYRVKILGYGEDGNFCGIGKFIYSNGIMDEFNIEFSRYETNPNYDLQYVSNRIIWEGERKNGEYDMSSFVSKRDSMRILAMSCPLNTTLNLKQIMLPNIPNLHILAITIDTLQNKD